MKKKGSIASWILQKFIKPGDIVETLIQSIAGSSKDKKGYSHPIKTLLLERLKLIEKLLETPKSSPNKPISEGRKKELERIITQLIEILNKSECSTIDEINHINKGTDLFLKQGARAAEKFVIQQLMNSLILIIYDLFESNVNKDRLEELPLQVLKVTNEAFLPMKHFSDEEMEKTEKDIDETLKRILSRGIDLGIARIGGTTTKESSDTDEPKKQLPVPFKTKLFNLMQSIPFKTKLFNLMQSIPSMTFSSFRIKKYYQIKELASQTYAAAAEASPEALVEDFSNPELIKRAMSLLCSTLNAHEIAANKVKGLFRMATDSNIYLCAAHHLVMIPHVEAMKKKKH